MKLPLPVPPWLKDRLGALGLVGERKALALLCLGFYTTLFFMIGLSARTELPEWLPVFGAMTLLYAAGFFAVAADWFWGRWFAIGLGTWGVSLVGMAFVATRTLPLPLVVFGVMHGIVALCMMGEKMAATYDAQPGWRNRWKLDDQGVLRVRRSVTRAASSLPALILFALAPRQGEEARLGTAGLASVALLAAGVVSLAGFLGGRRTWAVLGLGAVGLGTLVVTALGGDSARAAASPGELVATLAQLALPGLSAAWSGGAAGLFALGLGGLGLWAGLLLAASAAPFARPILAFLRGR